MRPDREEVRLDGPKGSGGVCWISKMIFLPESQGFLFSPLPRRRRVAVLPFGLPVVLVNRPADDSHLRGDAGVLGKVEEEAADRGNKTDSQTLSRRGGRGLRGQGVTLPVKKKKRKASSWP